MTTTPMSSPPGSAPAPISRDHALRSRWSRIFSALQLVLSIAVTGAVLAYLILIPHPTPDDARREAPAEAVQVVGPKLIRISPGTALEKKVAVADVRSHRLSDPILTVTGTVVASMRPGHGKGADFWQFNSPEVLAAYTDWQKAIADIAFLVGQQSRIKELAEFRVASQKQVVARMQKLVEAGTDTPKDLAVEETNLRQYEIQGRKEVHEAENAVLMAKRTEAALARQLQQAGLEPELLRSATADMDVVMADVPEVALTRVKVDQGCEARFFGLPDEAFPGKVRSIAPVLSKERRSLRALFVIHDPKDQLRPGMFAEIGLGTDEREATLVPADAVVHVGRGDYVLAGTDEPGVWRVAEVKVGELHGSEVEILKGLGRGERVLGKGAILLKPVVIRTLQAPANERKGPEASR